MHFRLSQQLARRVKVSLTSILPLAEDPLTDWSAHVFSVAGTQYILLSNTQSLYSAILSAKGKNNAQSLIINAHSAIRDAMAQDGYAAAYEERIASASGVARFGRALSRSVIGSMNQMIFQATIALEEYELSPDQAGQRLNDCLLSRLAGNDGQRYGTPLEVFTRLVDRKD